MRLFLRTVDDLKLYAHLFAEEARHHCCDGSLLLFCFHCLPAVVGSPPPTVCWHSGQQLFIDTLLTKTNWSMEQIVAVIICDTGIALLVYMDGVQHHRTLWAVLIAFGSAIGSSIFRVILIKSFNRLIIMTLNYRYFSSEWSVTQVLHKCHYSLLWSVYWTRFWCGLWSCCSIYSEPKP